MPVKILYIMHVDWHWIKQRPHFIAEHLSRHCKLLVVYPFAKKRSLLVERSGDSISTIPFLRFPFRHRIPLVEFINRFILKTYFRIIFFVFRPDCIWLTYPELFDYLPISSSKIVYDCMDNVVGFKFQNDAVKKTLLSSERKLIHRAQRVFVSSQKLREVLVERGADDKKLFLLRNASSVDVHSYDAITVKPRRNDKNEIFRIGYIGTIASWLDFDALSDAVEQVANVEFHMIGPSEIDLSSHIHDRIRFHGPLSHAKLKPFVEKFDALIMPFKINDLVESVDPVKLYDYINFNKPIISVYYPEIERFSPFVSFYSKKEDLPGVLNKLIQSGFQKKYSDNERAQFLKSNSWDVRTGMILEFLESEF